MSIQSLDSVTALRDAVSATRLKDAEAAKNASAISAQLDDYVIPRLANIDAPLLAVVGGSTGSGKSTLVNSIVGEEVTLSGVIRPTTRQPVLVTNPADREWFNSPHVLPGLAREQGEVANPQATSLRIVGTEAVQPGLALLDAPDFDSIDDRNRQLASQLLAAADLWVFVTTPARYADNLVWNFLHDAASRNIEVMVILNRVDADAETSVPDDLRRMMDEAGLGQSPLFVVPFDSAFEGFLPGTEEIRAHLHTLAADSAARRAMAGKTVLGALTQVVSRVGAVADTRQAQEEFAASLGAQLDELYEAAGDAVLESTSDGKLLRQEVMARWQDFVGTSDAFRTVERWYSTARDKIGEWFTGRPAPVREVETEIEEGLHAVIVDAAETAAHRSWSLLGSQAAHLRADAPSELSAASSSVSEDAAQLVRDWQAHLVETIQETAGAKRMRARVMSIGLNVVTVALMLVVFASTAGLTGGEIAIAGGSAVVGQRLLETIFGEDAVRRMAKEARDDLDRRVEALLDSERARYGALTNPLEEGTSAAELRAAASQALSATESDAQASLASAPQALEITPPQPVDHGVIEHHGDVAENSADTAESRGGNQLDGLLRHLRGEAPRNPAVEETKEIERDV